MPTLSLTSLVITASRGAVLLVAGVFAGILVGCAQLPKEVYRPTSFAAAPNTSVLLSQLAEDRRISAGNSHPSGFLLLSGPQEAYSSRLALVENAQKSLDLQYYAIHADASSERLLRGVVAAARRGVRVRVLLDDFHSTGRNALVMGMAFQPNVEMRMFNPVAGPRGSMLGRLWGSVTDFSRVQQRMHNKLFIADNVMGVTGGRNLGDAYFGNAESDNFVDVDVLAVGPIVQDLSRSFDSYWNNERAYPVQSLITQQELARLREQTTEAAVASQPHQGDGNDNDDLPTPARAVPETSNPRGDGPKPPDGEPRPSRDGPTQAQRDWAWNQQPMDLRTAAFVWAPAVMLADRPAKIPAEGDRAAPAADTKPGAAVQVSDAGSRSEEKSTPIATTSASPRTQALQASAEHAAQGDTVVDGLLQLLAQARQDLLIISPYFVPGDDMKKAFAEARARGVRVRVLTNSLASNDAPVAHVGYARHREELLAMGVELYELRSEQSGLKSTFGSSGATATGESRSMLHSKVLVLDGRLLVVGSMNLDLRSQLQNTEIALLIQSRALSRMASEQIETAMRDGAWRLEKTEQGLIWHAPQGSGLQDAKTDPDTGLGLRLLLKLLGPLAPDHLL